jgi:NAD(P)-dependent dehydrogenase (short-subunit alcohol dehydrogenase family)
LQDRVALVTGAASERGIGRAIALGYAREGAAVACVDLDGDGARAAAGAVEAEGAAATAIACDVSDGAQVRDAVARAVEALGRLDILVNNAGFARFGRLLETSEDDWDRTMAVNFKGQFLFAQAAARRMIEQGTAGAIVNVFSVSADTAGGMKVPYCVSKAGVKMLTQGAAIEWARYQIRVNAVAPGDMATNIVRDERVQRALQRTDYTSVVLLGRRGAPDDVVGAAIFLASDEAAYITGAHLLIDGGLTAGGDLDVETD